SVLAPSAETPARLNWEQWGMRVSDRPPNPSERDESLQSEPVPRIRSRVRIEAGGARMRIESSQIGMSSQHQAVAQSERGESLRAWVGDRRPDFERTGGGPAGGNRTPAVSVELGTGPAPARSTWPPAAAAGASPAEPGDATDGDAKLQLLISLVERLTG